MKFKKITAGLYGATHASVNVFALRDEEGVVLIDTGSQDFAPLILDAVAPLGPIRHIVVTHAHPDHAGSTKALVDQTAATVWMHTADAALVAEGRSLRPYRPSPTLIGQLITRLSVDRQPQEIPAVTDIQQVEEGETIPVAGGLTVIHMPGHSAGHMALAWSSPTGERVLFAADVCVHIFGLSEPVLYEDRERIAQRGTTAVLYR